MAYTTIDKSSLHFNTKLYTGDGEPAGNAITGVGFQPDWVWTKERSSANSHLLFDAVRGVTKSISSNSTAAQVTDAQYLTAFGTDGFTVGPSNDINEPSSTYASWNWKANGAGSSNTDGSITSTVSANTTSGFSIVTYTGTGSVGTIGHGLSAVPKMIIVKRLDSASSWSVYHSVLGNANQLYLNTTDASTSSTGWNSTDPTSSVFSIGSTGSYNGSGNTYVAYCFAEKKGFSKAFSYTGNGSTNGSFCYLGFRPAFVMIKSSSNITNWYIFDTARNTYNVSNKILYPDLSNAEYSGGGNEIDILSNGFKARSTNGDTNGSGRTYVGIAFAENPLVSSNGVPAVAR